MTVQFSQKVLTAFSASPLVTRSGLVRRLVRACNDPGKERIRKWLINIDDAKLQSDLGLTLEDIAVLRTGTKAASPTEDSGCPHQPLCRNLRALAERSRG